MSSKQCNSVCFYFPLIFFILLYACSSETLPEYSPPSALELADPSICFEERRISAAKGGEILLTKEECGSLRYSKVIFAENSISENTTFRFETADSIINEPSFLVNYSVKISPISPSTTSIKGAITIEIPYVHSVLATVDLEDVDVVSFFKSANDPSKSLLRTVSAIDDTKKIISTVIDSFGSYQPGVKINSGLSIGDVVDFDFGNLGSSYLFDSSPDQTFSFMISGHPGTLYSDPISYSPASFTFTIDTSSPSASTGMSKISNASNENIRSFPFFDPHEKLRMLFKERMEALKNGASTDTFMKTPNIPAPADLSLGERIAGFYLIDWQTGGYGFLENQEAIVVSIGTNAVALFHDSDGSYDSLTQQEKDYITASSDDLINEFDTIIHPRSTLFFGEPSDVDNNNVIFIFISDTFLYTGVLGYFYLGDTFTNLGETNLADIIYITGESAETNPLTLKSVIAHEYQHLINNHNKTLKHYPTYVSGTPVTYSSYLPDLTYELVGIDEGLSHFAQDVVGYADTYAGIPDILNFPNPAARPYLLNNWSTSLIAVDNFQIEYPVRGQNYLFIRYLFEQAGGANFNESTQEWEDTGGIAFIKEFISSATTGLNSVESIFPTYDSLSRGFSDAFLDWLVTLYNDGFDGSINTAERYNYTEPLAVGLINPGQTAGIDLTSTRTLVDTLEDIVLDGPKVLSFNLGQTTYSSDMINLGAGYVEYKLPSTYSDEYLRFKITSDGDPIVRLMRKE